MPSEAIFPLKAAADRALYDFRDPEVPETPDAPSGMILPFAGDDYVAARSKRIYITQRRIDEICPSEAKAAIISG